MAASHPRPSSTPAGAAPSVVGLGGGHGLAATLTAARSYAGSVTAVVSVADDGGSSGRLRRDLGIPAPGDVRRCLAALAGDRDGAWVRAFETRFTTGDLAGHALGNLVIAALAATTGSFTQAVREAGTLLDARGRVLPATTDPVVLVAQAAGRRIVGQTAVEALGEPIDAVGIEPGDAPAPPEVIEAISTADQVVIGPGSLYTSVLATLAVADVRAALSARPGGVVFVCNLKASQETAGYDAARHVRALLEHGVTPTAVLVDPGAISLGRMPAGPEVVSTPLACANGWSHDPQLLARALADLVGA